MPRVQNAGGTTSTIVGAAVCVAGRLDTARAAPTLHRRPSLTTWLVFLALVSVSLVQLDSQTAPAQPRTPWGTPDLAGIWSNGTLTPLERPRELGTQEFFTEAERAQRESQALGQFLAATGLARDAEINAEFTDPIWMEPAALSRRTSLIVGPVGRIPELTSQAQERRKARSGLGADRTDSHEDRPLGERCLKFSGGGPPMMPFPILNLVQIFQTPDHVAILNEENHPMRIIPLDGRPHVGPEIRLWHGDSRAHWESDTLVIDITNFDGKGAFRGAGPNLHVTERFRRVDADTISYEFSVADADTWVQPWTAEIPLRRTVGPLFEHACHEGNYSLVNILSAARSADSKGRRR